MKILFLLGLSLFTTNVSHAQPALDQTVILGTGDYCYEDAHSAPVIYCMPRKLCRQDQPQYQFLDGVWHATFSMGICSEEIGRLNSLMKTKNIVGKDIRFQRGIDLVPVNGSEDSYAKFQFTDFMQISKRYHPQVTALGDYLNLMGPTTYSLQVNPVHGALGLGRDRAPETLDSIFFGKQLDYLGTLQYFFLGQINKSSVFARTVIPLYVGEAPKTDLFTMNFLFSEENASSFDLNSKTNCWSKPTLNRICVLDKQGAN